MVIMRNVTDYSYPALLSDAENRLFWNIVVTDYSYPALLSDNYYF